MFWKRPESMGWGNVIMSISHLITMYGEIRVHSSLLDVERGVTFCDAIKFVDEEEEPVGEPKLFINQQFYQYVHSNISKIIKPSPEVQELINKYRYLLDGVVRGIHIRRGAYSTDSSNIGCHGRDSEGNIIPAYFASDAALKKFETVIEKSQGPVFLASDSKEIKDLFTRKYPDTVRIYDTQNIVLTYNCNTLGNNEVTAKDRLDCYVEWFLLSMCPRIYITGGDGDTNISTYGYTAACYGHKDLEIILN